MLSVRSVCIKSSLWLVLIFTFQVSIMATDTSQNFNKVSLVSVYDGDTIRVHLACKYGVFCKTIPIRVRGVDCPEIKGGSAETKELAKQAKAARVIEKETLNGREVVSIDENGTETVIQRFGHRYSTF